MKTFYNTFKTDPNAEAVEGVDLDYGDAGVIVIHRAGGSNQKYKNYVKAKLAPYMRRIEAGTLGEETQRELMADVYAKTVIVGWRDVKGEDGKPMEYSYENVVKLLTDLPDLFEDIQKCAQDQALFRAAETEEIVGNSAQPSAGI